MRKRFDEMVRGFKGLRHHVACPHAIARFASFANDIVIKWAVSNGSSEVIVEFMLISGRWSCRRAALCWVAIK